ncbi:hypothetical protein AAFF_G00100520 [Aldrovandia affinis]|uniref:SUN domain-containing protein n=1 Tax=Aldrovandia affinis TaxID=143900 RepID=A0AAD7WB71_9TELE|nr:hypothetical protein AAFF_G00100520 [Aldrovandia affinis]
MEEEGLCGWADRGRGGEGGEGGGSEMWDEAPAGSVLYSRCEWALVVTEDPPLCRDPAAGPGPTVGFKRDGLGGTSSYSTAALSFEQENRIAPVFDSPRMSRRSLRLHTTGGHYGDDSLLDSSLNHSVTYSSSLANRKESRTLKSRRQHQSALGSQSMQYQSVPGSQSLLLTPRKSQSVLHGHSSMHSCATSDASILSSLLDESCIPERTLVDSFWGLDENTELKEGSVRADCSTAQLNGDMNSAQTQTSVLNGYVCRDCTVHERKDAHTAYSSSRSCSGHASHSASASAHPPPAADPASPASSTVYSRDKSRKHKPGLLGSVSDTFRRYSTRALASVVSILFLLVHSVQLKRLKEGRGALASLSQSCMHYSRRAGASVVSWVTLMVHNVLLKIHRKGSDVSDRAHSSYCGSLNVKDLMAGDGHLAFNGSLCDDCKRKEHLETLTVQAQSSRARRLVGALWRSLCFTGCALLQVARALGSAGWFVSRTLLSVLWLAAASPGKAASRVFWWLGTAWYQLVTLMSLLNVFILTRFLPKLYKLLLFLLPFLLLLGLWYWGPSSVLSYLPAINLTEWRVALQPAQPWGPAPATPLEQVTEAAWGHPATALPPAASQQEGMAVGVGVDVERLSRLEKRLAQLWEGVQSGGRLQEQQHGKVLGLYGSLREQLDRQTDRDSLGLWVSGLLDQRLTVLREELQQDTAQSQQQYVVQQQASQSHASRLAELEALLQVLAAKTEEVQQRQEMAPPAPVSVGVDSEAHDALLGQVERLEAELGRIRQDLQAVTGCQGRCEQLDSLQDTVSAQVRRELRALFYGSALAQAEEEGAELPESLLQWLSAQFVRSSDLQSTLASLETRILRNVSLQLERSGEPPCARPSRRLWRTSPGLLGCQRSTCS